MVFKILIPYKSRDNSSTRQIIPYRQRQTKSDPAELKNQHKILCATKIMYIVADISIPFSDLHVYEKYRFLRTSYPITHYRL